MKTDVPELRERIAQLYPKRDRGDLPERDFQELVAEQTVALYRAVITEKMAEGETIECEHHTIWTHFRLMQSILREPAQQAISLFLTNRRLYRLQSTIMPDQPPTADSRDNTSIDEISFDRIAFLKKKFQIRTGELLLGAGFCAVAVVFHDWLSITGPVLVGLGALGVLHSLVMPTRWIEVKTVDVSPTTNPILIYAVRKKSAKALVRRLREKLSIYARDNSAAC
ncbi:MAG TPA: hypothetical protein VMC85_03985 [Desulfomonilaceae bacterium]|nr:hypothetical protein [Desulfomonilaceae bacterium]